MVIEEKKNLPSYKKIEEIFNSLDSLLVDLDQAYKPSYLELFTAIHMLELKVMTFYIRSLQQTDRTCRKQCSHSHSHSHSHSCSCNDNNSSTATADTPVNTTSIANNTKIDYIM